MTSVGGPHSPVDRVSRQADLSAKWTTGQRPVTQGAAGVTVQPSTIEFGAVAPGTVGGKLAYIDNCPAATAMTVSVDGSPVFSVSRVVVSHWETRAVDPSELPPHHGPPPARPAPTPTERVVVQDSENDGSGPLGTTAGSILTVYVAGFVPIGATDVDIHGVLVVSADGQQIVQVPLHAMAAGVTLRLQPDSFTLRQGESVDFLLIATPVGGPDTDVTVSLVGGQDAGGITLQSAGTHLAAGQPRSFPGTLTASTDCLVGAHSGWVLAEAFGGLQGANDARGRFLGVRFSVAVNPGKPAVAGPLARYPVLAGSSVAVPMNVWLGSANGQVDIAFSGGSLPPGITMSPSPQWITAVDNVDFRPGMPDNNVNAQGMVQGPVTLTAAPGFLGDAAETDLEVPIDWTADNSGDTGTVAVKLGVFAPTAHITTFDPNVDGYAFNNHWFLTSGDGETIRNYFGNALDDVMSVCEALIAASLVGIGGIVITAVVEEVSPALRNEIHNLIIGSAPGAIGLCGGMAFSSLDYYRAGIQLPDIATRTSQPDESSSAGDALRRQIWDRLLDSLGGNGSRFMQYLVTLHILPGLVGGALGAVVGAAVGGSVGIAGGIAEGGAVGGPVGGLVGGVIGGIGGAIGGGETIVIDLGGSKKLMEWSRQEWTTLKRHLDAGEPWPVGLVGDNPNPLESHQMVAIGYDDRAGPQQISFYVYDNNYPMNRGNITIDLRGDTMQSTTNIPDASWMPLQGIICENYTSRQPPRIS